jgi:hypothetical protein
MVDLYATSFPPEDVPYTVTSTGELKAGVDAQLVQASKQKGEPRPAVLMCSCDALVPAIVQ